MGDRTVPTSATWTQQELDQIPRVYRDFLLALRPVLDFEDGPLKITGIPRGRIQSLLTMKGHHFEFDALASELEAADLVRHDRLGFYVPTAKGASLIRALFGPTEPAEAPPLPPFLKG
jgi:hypothetical protein